MRCSQSDKDMDMISRSSHGVGHSVKAPNYAAKILMDTHSRSRREPWLAIFRAEY